MGDLCSLRWALNWKEGHRLGKLAVADQVRPVWAWLPQRMWVAELFLYVRSLHHPPVFSLCAKAASHGAWVLPGRSLEGPGRRAWGGRCAWPVLGRLEAPGAGLRQSHSADLLSPRPEQRRPPLRAPPTIFCLVIPTGLSTELSSILRTAKSFPFCRGVLSIFSTLELRRF